MLRATLNQPVPLQVLAADGRTDLFARADLYSGGALLTTLTLAHIAEGLYGVVYTPLAEGYFSVIYQLFEDALFAVPAAYDLESEMAEVSSDKTNLLRLLGLVHENAVFDLQTYDGGGNLLTGRLRAYDSKTNAESSGLTGLLFTWAVLASYTDGKLSKYQVTRES